MKNKVILIKTLALIMAFLSSFEAFSNDYTVTVRGFYFGYDPSTGKNFPLSGARIILLDSDADGSTIFDDEMGSSHIKADGSFTVTGRGGDPGSYSWSKPDVYIRVVYNNDKGVRLTDELDNDRYVDTPQHDHNNVEGDLDFGTWTVGLDGDKGNGTKCSVWMAGCKAWDEYVNIMGAIPPSGKLDIEYWSAFYEGTPWTNTTTTHWPTHFPSYSMKHEFGHLIRHAFDGNADHFAWDATRFRYGRSHSRCDRNSNRIGTDTRDMGLAFGFNEGWAEFWADDVRYCGYDFDEECEGNIASALYKISNDPRYGIGNKSLGKKGMVEILKAHPGEIHSLDDFLKFVLARTSFNLTEVQKALGINKAVVGSSPTINNNAQAKATVSNRIVLSNAQRKESFDKIYQTNLNTYNQILNSLNKADSKNPEIESSKRDIKMKFAKFQSNAKNGIFPISAQTQSIFKEDMVRQTVQRGKQIVPTPPKVFYSQEDQYLVGDWNGDGKDNIAVRRGNQIIMDFNFDGVADRTQVYGNGNSEDQYLVGDWDGDGKDNIAVRRGNQIIMDYDFDGVADRTQVYGNGNSEDQYLVGDWNGDGKDNIAVRRGNQIIMDFNFDGVADRTQVYGNGNSEDQYLVGDWDGDGKDNIAVRRGNQIIMDYDFDGVADFTQVYGNGISENQYLSGDWDGDKKSNIAVRRNNEIVMDYNFDSAHDQVQVYGNGKS